MHLNFLGLFNFTAPYLPWVLLAFSVTLRSNAVVDLLGIVAGMSLFHFLRLHTHRADSPLLLNVSSCKALGETLDSQQSCYSASHRACHASMSLVMQLYSAGLQICEGV